MHLIIHILVSISSLEGQKGILKVLVYLLNVREANRQKITDELTSDARITNACIRKLEELQLIDKSIKEAGRAGQQLVRVFRLTDKGKKVAKLLKEIEGVLEAKGND